MSELKVGDRAIIERDHFRPRDRSIEGLEVEVERFFDWGDLVFVSFEQVVGERRYPLSVCLRSEGLRKLPTQRSSKRSQKGRDERAV